MKYVALALLALATPAHADLFGKPDVKNITLPNGKDGFAVTCKGREAIAKCYERAGKICGTAGYTLFDSQTGQRTSGVITNGTGTIVTQTRTTLVFSCGQKKTEQ